MALTVTALQRAEEITGLRDEWQALHESSGDTNPFSSPAWAATWVEHFGGQPGVSPLVLAVRDARTLVAVAPLYRRTAAAGLARTVLPIGTGHPWIGPYEVPAMVAATGRGQDSARAVVEYLCRHADRWDWAQLVFGAAAPWLQPEWLPSGDFTALPRSPLPTVVLHLGDDIYAGRRNLKESFRRARNRLTRDFGDEGWSVRRVSGEGLATAFNRLEHLHGARSELADGRPSHTNVVEEHAVAEYLADVVARAGTTGSASIYELHLGDDVVASQLVLHTATGSYSSISGLADAAWPYSAVTYLQSVAVQDARDAGHARFCLSLGPNRAKLRWTDSVDTVTEFAIIAPRARSRMLYLASDALNRVSSYRAERRAHRV